MNLIAIAVILLSAMLNVASTAESDASVVHDIDQFISSAIQHLNQIPLIRSLSLAIDFNFFPVRFINSSFVFA